MGDLKGFWIPLWLFNDERLSMNEKIILAEIASLSKVKGCFAKNTHFEELFKLSKNTVHRAIKKLKEEGYISVILTNRNHTREIRIELTQNGYNTKSELTQNGVKPYTQNGVKPYTQNGVETIDTNSFNQFIITNTVKEWVDYRKEIKKPLTKASINKLIKDEASNPTEFAEKVEHSISNGYQGLFAPKQQNSYNSKSQAQVGSVMWQIKQEQKQKGGDDYVDVQIEGM